VPSARHGDVELHWLRAGDPAGEPVVLIMGLSGSHRDWHRLVPHLPDHDVILFDNRGTGRSSPVDGFLTMADMVRDTLAVLDAAGVERAHVHAPILYADRTRAAAPGRVAADLAIRRENATDGRTTMGQIAAIARHDTHERLHELGRLPVTVIHGGLDLLVPPSHGRALADGIPGSRLVMLEEAAHILTTDDEPGLARAVQEHLERAAEHERSMAR
jgi:pimeloyl-ACP methyl ester carboxylesterase